MGLFQIAAWLPEEKEPPKNILTYEDLVSFTPSSPSGPASSAPGPFRGTTFHTWWSDPDLDRWMKRLYEYRNGPAPFNNVGLVLFESDLRELATDIICGKLYGSGLINKSLELAALEGHQPVFPDHDGPWECQEYPFERFRKVFEFIAKATILIGMGRHVYYEPNR